MNFPAEILELIALNLNSIDLGNFRLAHYKFANACTSLVVRNGISVLMTTECLQELRQFLEWKQMTDSTKKITICYAEWPLCTRNEWEAHPSLFGNHIPFRLFSPLDVDKAYSQYAAFLSNEARRYYDEDVDTIYKALTSLRNLNDVIISHTKTWSWNPPQIQKYYKLQRRIWMTPHATDEVNLATQTFLLAFGNGSYKNNNIKALTIRGAFNPAHIYLGSGSQSFRGIRTLEVKSFHVHHNQDTIQKFLEAFPDLIHLSVSFESWGYVDTPIPGIFKGSHWPYLENLQVNEIWLSEDDLYNVIKCHLKTLKSLTLGNAALTDGSWRSFFTRVRNLEPQVTVKGNGELYGRRFRHRLDLCQEVIAHMLANFMRDKDLPWPFDG